MSNSSDNVGRREAMLLLYVNDELGREERAEIERLVARDPSARQMLDEFRAVRETVESGLARLDELAPVSVSAATVARNVGRSMRQWRVEQDARRPLTPRAPASRFGWRSYTLAAASTAAAVVAVILWTNQPETTQVPAPTAGLSPMAGLNLAIVEDSVNALGRSFGEDSLGDAEEQLSQLRLLRGDGVQ